MGNNVIRKNQISRSNITYCIRYICEFNCKSCATKVSVCRIVYLRRVLPVAKSYQLLDLKISIVSSLSNCKTGKKKFYTKGSGGT